MVRSPSLTIVAPTPFFTEGGCSYRVLGETRAFVRAGVPVHLLTYPAGRDVSGIEITRPRRSKRQMGIGLNPIRTLYDAELLRLMMRQVPHTGFLHVHLHEGAFLGALLKRLRGVPFVADLEGSLVEEVGRTFPGIAKGPPGFIARRFERALESSASQVVVSSQGLYADLTRKGHLSPEKLHLVPDGVDVAEFTPRDRTTPTQRSRWRQSLGLRPTDLVAVYVGGISPEQGIDDLLELAPGMVGEAKDLKFVIYGTATQLNPMKRYHDKVHELGLDNQVLFPGPIRFEDVPSALAACDLAFTWKRSVLEGSGKIPLYMAAGLPTVAMETPAHAYYLGQDGSKGGVIVRSPVEAAKAVVELALDEEKRTRLGTIARGVCEREFSWDRAAQDLMKIHAMQRAG